MPKLFKSFRLDPDIYAMLVRQAEENQRSMAGQIEYLVKQEEIKNEKLKASE